MRMERRTVRVLASILLGLGLSILVTAYPEEISSTGGFNPPRPERPQWHHRTSRCSLLDVLAHGFHYQPKVADATVIYRRSPVSLLWYAVLIPVSVAFLYVAIGVSVAAVLYWRECAARILRSRGRKVLSGLVGLVIASHVVSVLYMIPGGMGRLDPWGIPLRLAGSVQRILLPLTIANRYLLYGISWLNLLVFGNTSPRVGFPTMPPSSPYGTYRCNGLLWEGICVVLLIVIWVFIVGLVSDMFAAFHAGPNAVVEREQEGSPREPSRH